MNIRVDIDTPIRDGMEVVFRSPVDCAQITGLKVYHKGNDGRAFAFADAHGNNVGDIEHLFAENAVVKVILDLTSGMAFVQNADTNAYLERRFEAIEKAIGMTGETTIIEQPLLDDSGAALTEDDGTVIVFNTEVPSAPGIVADSVLAVMEVLIALDLVPAIADADGAVLAESDGTILCDI